uniref:Uncharacterized protein n=1 Tax=Panagrolaimus sp. ES5 TaxID=591445 RepID=A0AC34FIS0_9BILA
MLSRLNAIYAEKKQLIGFINTSIGDHHGNSFDFIIVDPLTENKMASITYKIDRIQAFLEILPTMKNVFKGIIIDLFKLNLRGTPYHFSYKYCEELRKIFRQKKIPSVFLTEQICIFTSYLIAAKINVEFDDTVLFVLTADVYKDGKETLGVLAATFKFTPNGYQLINIKKISSFNAKEKPELLHRQICGDSSLNPPPKHVIIPTYGSKKIPFKKIFKSYNLILINACVENFQKEFLIETCKWLLDKSYIKYHILPLCSRDIQVYGYFGTDENILDILHVDTNDPLPISKTAIQSRSLPKSVVNYSIERVDYGIEGRLPPICH